MAYFGSLGQTMSNPMSIFLIFMDCWFFDKIRVKDKIAYEMCIKLKSIP